MAAPMKLSGQEIRRLKNDLKDCADIKADFERAKLAGVPNLEHVEEKLDVLTDRITKLLTVLGGVEIQ